MMSASAGCYLRMTDITMSRILPSLACYGLNRLLCQCEAFLSTATSRRELAGKAVAISRGLTVPCRQR